MRTILHNHIYIFFSVVISHTLLFAQMGQRYSGGREGFFRIYGSPYQTRVERLMTRKEVEEFVDWGIRGSKNSKDGKYKNVDWAKEREFRINYLMKGNEESMKAHPKEYIDHNKTHRVSLGEIIKNELCISTEQAHLRDIQFSYTYPPEVLPDTITQILAERANAVYDDYYYIAEMKPDSKKSCVKFEGKATVDSKQWSAPIVGKITFIFLDMEWQNGHGNPELFREKYFEYEISWGPEGIKQTDARPVRLGNLVKNGLTKAPVQGHWNELGYPKLPIMPPPPLPIK